MAGRSLQSRLLPWSDSTSSFSKAHGLFAVILRLRDDQRTAKSVRRRLDMSDFNVGFVIFPDITQLDFTGPFEVLSRLATPPSISASSAFAHSRTHIIAKSMQPVLSDRGLGLMPNLPL